MKSHATVVKYCDWLAKQNSEALSFIPRPRLEDYALRGQILTESDNGDTCGFLVFGNGFPFLRIYQAAIQYDARRRDHGLALLSKLVDKATAAGVYEIRLRCAQDLEANEFWKAAGFTLLGTAAGGVRRGRTLNRWGMRIKQDPQQELFTVKLGQDLHNAQAMIHSMTK